MSTSLFQRCDASRMSLNCASAPAQLSTRMCFQKLRAGVVRNRDRVAPVSVTAKGETEQPQGGKQVNGKRGLMESVRSSAAMAAAVSVLLSSQLAPIAAHAEELLSGLEPSPLNLQLKPRIQEIILESKASHDGEDFTREDLTGAIFGEAELKEANFEGSDLRAAVFSRSVMYKANLSNCDMTDTMMDYVVLRGANLRGSIMTNANFIRSDLGDTDITDADFTEAIIDKYQLKYLCSVASGKNPATGADTFESLGCENVEFYKGFNAGLTIKPVDANKK